jgi:hypothetical protein
MGSRSNTKAAYGAIHAECVAAFLRISRLASLAGGWDSHAMFKILIFK